MNGGDPSQVGLGPPVVTRAFDVPASVLAFHDTGIGAWPAFGQEPSHELGDGVAPEPVSPVSDLRGEKRPVGRWTCGRF